MPMYKNSLVVLLVIAAAVFGGTIYGSSTSEHISKLDKAVLNDDRVSAIDDNNAGSNTIFVYVTGGVNKPGMVELEANKVLRVADAVETCGGLLPTADVDNINLAETISDGQHIRIPEKVVEQSVQNQTSDTTVNKTNNSDNNKSNNSGSIVNINTAGPEELQTLSGIGPKMAAKIIEYRQANGAFKSIEELQNVRGIGVKTFEKLKNRLRV
ncbi:MAG: helix-hairpin-helix domain-containing protein [Selenomonadaceae bacterium]|nr:helix-hairpin-helix domain-containing protein [Selenomonadaceae bacterium]